MLTISLISYLIVWFIWFNFNPICYYVSNGLPNVLIIYLIILINYILTIFWISYSIYLFYSISTQTLYYIQTDC